MVAGNIRLIFDWDWAGAEAEFRKAIEAAPGSSLAHMENAWCQWSAGRHDAALVHSQKALELDPLSRGPMPASERGERAEELGRRGDPQSCSASHRRSEVVTVVRQQPVRTAVDRRQQHGDVRLVPDQ